MKTSIQKPSKNHAKIYRIIDDAIKYVYWDSSPEDQALLINIAKNNNGDKLEKLSAIIANGDEYQVRKLFMMQMLEMRQMEIDQFG